MKPIACALLMILPSSAHAVLPGDSGEGKRLHDASCMGCHDTSVYSRSNRTVHSLDGLKQRLGECSHMAKKEFSATETRNVLKYLNDSFYRFQ